MKKKDLLERIADMSADELYAADMTFPGHVQHMAGESRFHGGLAAVWFLVCDEDGEELIYEEELVTGNTAWYEDEALLAALYAAVREEATWQFYEP